MIQIPESFRSWMIQSNGTAGAAWIASIPQTFEDLASRWNLGNPGLPLHGGAAIVIPVTWNDQPAMLKLAFDASTSTREAVALHHWNGHGLVQLLHHDDRVNALLLERIGPDHLDTLPVVEAVQTIAQLLRLMAIAPHPDLPTVTTTAADIATHIERRWNQAGSPCSAMLMDRCRNLIAEHAGDRTMLMVNKDLHYRNVLRGQRLPWIVIDPQPYVGPPEFAIASILLRTLDRTSGPAELRQVFRDIVDTASLDWEKSKDWTIVRIVDYWLWALENGLTEDPVRCATVLDWLDLIP